MWVALWFVGWIAAVAAAPARMTGSEVGALFRKVTVNLPWIGWVVAAILLQRWHLDHEVFSGMLGRDSTGLEASRGQASGFGLSQYETRPEPDPTRRRLPLPSCDSGRSPRYRSSIVFD